MMELFSRGGPVMWLILAASLAALTIFLERLFNLHRAHIKADDFVKGIYNVLKRGSVVEAVSICEDTPGPVAHIVRSAILRHDEGPQAVLQAIETTGLIEVPRLERNMGMLATIARTTPLLGLLGTVLGLMQLLSALQQKAPLVQISDLAGGLWQALIATAAGLVVAILAHAGYNFLVHRVEAIVLDMEKASSEITAFLAELKK